MNRNLLIAGGVAAIGAGALLYMKRNGLGWWSPGESGLDEAAAAGGGGFSAGTLTPEDRRQLGLGPQINASTPAPTQTYAAGIAAYMSAWNGRGAGVPADKAAAILEGGRGTDNVSCDTDLAKTSTGVPFSSVRDPASSATGTPDTVTTPDGRRYKVRPVRGFALNGDELAIYAPDAGRLWGLVEGVTANGTRVDLFVTPHGRQKIDRGGNVLGSGLVFAWHPGQKRWLAPNEWSYTALPSRQISSAGSSGTFGRTSDSDVYGYRDASCKRIQLGNLKFLARTSRTKSVPASVRNA